MSMNSRSLPQNKAPLGLDPLAKFCFCKKMCVNNPGTFVGNGRYYLEDQDEMSRALPEPTVAIVNACRSTITPSEPIPLVHAI